MDGWANLLLRCWPIQLRDKRFLLCLDNGGFARLNRVLVTRLGLNDDREEALFANIVFFVRFDDVVDQRTILWQK